MLQSLSQGLSTTLMHQPCQQQIHTGFQQPVNDVPTPPHSQGDYAPQTLCTLNQRPATRHGAFKLRGGS